MCRIFRKMKKCYNCKSKPVLTYRTLANGIIEYKLICENCGLEQFGYFDSKKEAIIAWNKGFNPSPLWENPQKINK